METAPAEETRQLSRLLDLNASISQLSNGVALPSEVTALGSIPYRWTGQLLVTDNINPRMYDAPKQTLLPRAGIAVLLNDRTAFRAGWARYAAPMVAVHTETGELPTYGYPQSTAVLGALNGTLRSSISATPFPRAIRCCCPPALRSAV